MNLHKPLLLLTIIASFLLVSASAEDSPTSIIDGIKYLGHYTASQPGVQSSTIIANFQLPGRSLGQHPSHILRLFQRRESQQSRFVSFRSSLHRQEGGFHSNSRNTKHPRWPMDQPVPQDHLYDFMERRHGR